MDDSLFKGRQIKVHFPDTTRFISTPFLSWIVWFWWSVNLLKILVILLSKVNPKRTNRPGISTTDRGSSRGRGRGRGFRGGLYNPYANFMPRPRGRAMFRSVMFSLWCWCNPFKSDSDQCERTPGNNRDYCLEITPSSKKP